MFKSIQDLVKKNYLSCDVADVLRQTQYIWYHCVLWQQKSIVNLIILWEKH